MRFGYGSSGLLLTNAPASKWFVAAGPRRNSHWSPMSGLRHVARWRCIDTGWVQACCT